MARPECYACQLSQLAHDSRTPTLLLVSTGHGSSVEYSADKLDMSDKTPERNFVERQSTVVPLGLTPSCTRRASTR